MRVIYPEIADVVAIILVLQAGCRLIDESRLRIVLMNLYSEQA